jgi:hypothetical protein
MSSSKEVITIYDDESSPATPVVRPCAFLLEDSNVNLDPGVCAKAINPVKKPAAKRSRTIDEFESGQNRDVDASVYTRGPC